MSSSKSKKKEQYKAEELLGFQLKVPSTPKMIPLSILKGLLKLIELRYEENYTKKKNPSVVAFRDELLDRLGDKGYTVEEVYHISTRFLSQVILDLVLEKSDDVEDESENEEENEELAEKIDDSTIYNEKGFEKSSLEAKHVNVIGGICPYCPRKAPVYKEDKCQTCYGRVCHQRRKEKHENDEQRFMQTCIESSIHGRRVKTKSPGFYSVDSRLKKQEKARSTKSRSPAPKRVRSSVTPSSSKPDTSSSSDLVKVAEVKEPSKIVEVKEPSKIVEVKEPSKIVEVKEPSKIVEVKEPSNNTPIVEPNVSNEDYLKDVDLSFIDKMEDESITENKFKGFNMPVTSFFEGLDVQVALCSPSDGSTLPDNFLDNMDLFKTSDE